MKTIAIFSGYILPHLGGVERYTDNLKHELVKKGYRVIIVTSNYDNSSNYITKEENVIIYKLPVFKIFKNRYPILKLNKLYRKIKKELADYNIEAIIVNTRFYLTSHFGANFGKKYNIPVFLIEHGSNYVTLNNKFIDFFANKYEDILTFLIKRKITGFYGVSEACGKWLRNFKINFSGTWYNSIDTNQKTPKKKLDNKEIIFLYAGRLIRQKGVENILKSFKNLEKDYKNIKLYIAGDGPELKNYKEEYQSKNIIFLGKLDYSELLKYYAKTTIFLYPPLWPEGLPTSILEAGLMKCCVIGTNQGGIKEIIQDKENGLIVGITQKELEKGMKELIVDKDLRVRLSEQLNKDIHNKFSWRETSKQILNDIGLENNEN